MATVGTGKVSLSDIAGVFGDRKPHSLSEFYRGGGLVQARHTYSTSSYVETRQPETGEFFDGFDEPYLPLTASRVAWRWQVMSYEGYGSRIHESYVFWNAKKSVAGVSNSVASSITKGSTTYFRGSKRRSGIGSYAYGVYRMTPVERIRAHDDPVNTGVPSEGALSISDFYGASVFENSGPGDAHKNERQPETGEYFDGFDDPYLPMTASRLAWRWQVVSYESYGSVIHESYVFWNAKKSVAGVSNSVASSITKGSTTYFRGSNRRSGVGSDAYGVYRIIKTG